MSRKKKIEEPTQAPDVPQEAVPEVKPEAAPKAAREVIPAPPALITGLAMAVQRQWGVPLWLTTLAAWTGSKYGTDTKGRHNFCGVLAEGSENKDADGNAWFPMVPMGFDRFGWICSRLSLNYDDPKSCVKALKSRCPNIDKSSYTAFMEA